MPYADRAQQNEYQRKRLATRRAVWLSENGPCRACSSWEDLEVDHVDPTTKVTHSVWSWSAERRAAELAKCQVLCGECHDQKTLAAYPERQHGTSVMYNTVGCRCAICRGYNTNKTANWRERTGKH